MVPRTLLLLLVAIGLAGCDPCGSSSTYSFNLFTGGMVWNPQLHYPGAAVATTSQGGRNHYLWTYRLDNVCRREPVDVTFVAGVNAQLASLGVAASGSFASSRDPPPAAPVSLTAGGTNALTGVTEWASEPVSVDLSGYFDDQTPAWVQYTLDLSVNAAISTKQIQDNNFIPYIDIESTFKFFP